MARGEAELPPAREASIVRLAPSTTPHQDDSNRQPFEVDVGPAQGRNEKARSQPALPSFRPTKTTGGAIARARLGYDTNPGRGQPAHRPGWAHGHAGGAAGFRGGRGCDG